MRTDIIKTGHVTKAGGVGGEAGGARACGGPPTARSEDGFVLVLCLIILLLLSFLGVWAMTRSDTENRVAVNLQLADRLFNVNEGANYTEASKVVHGRRDPWIDPGNIYEKNWVLLPQQPSSETTEPKPEEFWQAIYFPFKNRADKEERYADLLQARRQAAEGHKPPIQESTDLWPWENLEGDYESAGLPVSGFSHDASYVGHPSDYRYLVTYLMCDNVGQGYDGRTSEPYHTNIYRVQGAGAAQNGVVETAVTVVGPGGCN